MLYSFSCIGKLSRAANVDMNTLRRVYDDTRYSPTLAALEKLAKALGVKIADLIEEDDARHHPGYFNSPCTG